MAEAVLFNTTVKAKLLRSLGDASRLSILEHLRDGARCVSELVELTGLAQTNVSGHLACLRDCGLVDREQRGRFAIYRLGNPEIEKLLTQADVLLETIACLVDDCPMFEGGRGTAE